MRTAFSRSPPADVRRVAARYLTRDNRTIGYFLKTKTLQRAAIPRAPGIDSVVNNVRFRSHVARGEAFDPTWNNLRARAKLTTLPEGLKVAMLPRRTNGKSVVLTLILRYGNPQSLKGKWCDFIPEYMTRGTKRLNAEQLKLALTRSGTTLAFAGQNGVMRFRLKTDREHLAQALELLRQILREPALPPGELDKLKLKHFRKRLNQRPSLLKIAELFAGKYEPGDPRHFPNGRKGIPLVRGMTYADVKHIVDDSLGAHAGELIIVGDFDTDATLGRLQRMFRGWKGKVPYQRLKPARPAVPPAWSQSISRPGLANAYFDAAAHVAIGQAHPEYPALMLANAIVAARLRARIRDREGFSYRVSCRLVASPQDDIGRFTIAATCNPGNMSKLQAAVRDELIRIRRDGFSGKECRNAQASYLRQWKTARFTDSAIVAMLGTCLVLNRDLRHYELQEQQFRKLQPREISAAFRKYIDPDKLLVVTLGDLPQTPQPGPGKAARAVKPAAGK